MLRKSLPAALLLLLALTITVSAAEKMKALIVDGQNNHGNWPQTTKMMKGYLEETNLFDVDIATTGKDISTYTPDFDKYDVIVSNYNGKMWPQETQDAFIKYMKEGGGLVVIHAADNSFGGWKEYNEMIGLGGWGGRSEKSGPYVYYNDKGKEIRDESKGRGGSHGSQHPFQVVVRNPDHPITKGMPRAWLHEKDELYDRLRGPGTNMTILATAFADSKQRGTGRHEPMLMTIDYGKGRCFHTPMGHGDYSQECVGFIVSLQRGAEWAATGKVTQSIPDDFPKENEVSLRKTKVQK